jgi:Reverse transcriptase (RNA-dependent DNA polymerase)/Group II intron, maturase-specific domain
VAESSAPTGGRNPGGTGSRQPAGLCDLAAAGESIHALRVRCLDARKEFPHVSFERYCDDVVIHCASEAQAVYVKSAIGQRLRECRLEMNLDKTRIVYCKDGKRRGSYEHTRFVFLGYEFRVRRARTSSGKFFENFGPAISPEAATAIRHEMRSWHMARHTSRTLVELAEWANPRVQGWINYLRSVLPLRAPFHLSTPERPPGPMGET